MLVGTVEATEALVAAHAGPVPGAVALRRAGCNAGGDTGAVAAAVGAVHRRAAELARRAAVAVDALAHRAKVDVRYAAAVEGTAARQTFQHGTHILRPPHHREIRIAQKENRKRDLKCYQK